MSDFPERDVKEFSFRQMCKLRVSDQPFSDDSSCVGRYSLIAVSNMYGITYVGSPTDLKVIQTSEVGKIHHSNTSGDINTVVENLPMKRFPIPSIHHLGLSCDELTLSVCHTREDTLALSLYDTRAFLGKDPKPAFCKTKLSTVKGLTVWDVKWNPAHPNILACLRSDGTLVVLEVTDNNSMKVMATFDGTKGITAICWSPKGKQLVAGRQDGSFAQFTSKLEEKKSVPKPVIFGDSKAQVRDILWVSTYVFVVLYDVITDDASQPSLAVVSLPKKDEQRPTTYTNFEEICFGGGEDRDLKYFLHHMDEWGLVVCASSRSMEAAVIGRSLDDKNVWELWNLDDAGRAELPLSSNHDETYPMGMAVDLTSTNPIPIGENQSLPPMPMFMLLSTDGLLCPFYMVNTAPPQPLTIVKPPNALSAQGERLPPAQAASPVAAKPAAPVALQQPQPAAATAGKENAAPLPKPAAVPASASFSFTQPQPQAQPAAAPTSSLFTAPSSTPKMGLQSTPSTTSGGLSLFGSAASSATPKFGLSGASTTTSTSAGGITIGGNTRSAGFAFALPAGQQAGSSSAFSFSLPGSSQPGTTGATSSQGFSFSAPGTTAASTGPGASAFSMAAPAGGVKPAAVNITTATAGPTTTVTASTGLFSMPAATTVSGIAPAAPKTTGFSFGATSTGQSFSFRPGTTTAQPSVPQPVSKPAVQPQQSVTVQPGSKPPAMVQASSLQPGNGPTQVVKPSAQPAKPVAVTQPATSQPPPPPYKPPAAQPAAPVTAAATPAKPAQPPAEEAAAEEDTFSASILEEITHFESEVASLQNASVKTDWRVGHPDELKKLKEETQKIARFCEEIKDTTQSIHNDIHDLRTQTLETFAMLEEGKSRNDRNKEPYYHQLLRSQALDPASANKMKEIRQMYHYVDTTLRDVNNMLDDEWDKFKQQKTQKTGKLKSPALDVVYRAVSNHDKILHDQSQHIRRLGEQLKKMRLYNTTSSWTNRTVAHSITKTDTELSALADTLLHPRQETTPERRKKSSSASPLSSKKQSQLRELLGKRQVTPVRSTTPASVSQSRLMSPQRMYRSSPRPASSTPRGREELGFAREEGGGLPTPKPGPQPESPPQETPAGLAAQSRVKTVLQFSPPADDLPLNRPQPVPMTTKPPEPAATKPVPSQSSGFAPVPFSQDATGLKGTSTLTPKEAAAAAAMSRVGAANQQPAAFGSTNQKPPVFGSTNQQVAGFGSAIQQPAVSSTSNQQPLRFGATNQQSVLPGITSQFPGGLGLANQLEAEDDLADDGGSTEDVAPPVVNIKDVANLKPVSTSAATNVVSDSVNRNALEAAQKILQSATATSKPATTTAAMSVPPSTSGFSFAMSGQQTAFGQPASFGSLSAAPSTTAAQNSSTSTGSFVIGQGLSGSFSFKPAVTASLSSATQATQAQPKPVETKPTSGFMISFTAPAGQSSLSFGQSTSSFGFGGSTAASTTSTASGATSGGSLLAKTLAEKPQDVKAPGSEEPPLPGVEDITPPPTPEETPDSSTQVPDAPPAPKPSFDFSKKQTEADAVQPGGFFLSPKSDTPPPEPTALASTQAAPTPATVVESKPTATATAATTTSLFGQSATSTLGFGFGLNTTSGFSAPKPAASSGFSFASPASSTAVTSASTSIASAAGFSIVPTTTTSVGAITTTAASSADSTTTTTAAVPVQPTTTVPAAATTTASAQPVAATSTTPSATTSEQPTTTATTTTVSLFGQTTTNTTTAAFGALAQTTAASGGFLFAQQTTGGSTSAFGQPTTTVAGTSAFGAAASTGGTSLFASTSSGSLFGQSAATATTTTTSLFGQPAAASSNAFGQSSSSGFGFGQTPTSGGLFGTPVSSTATTGGLFGQTSTTGGLFGQSAFGSTTTTSSNGGGLFGTPSTTSTSSGLFGGGNTAGSSGGFFSGLGAKPSAEAANKNPFGGSTSFGTPSTSASTLFGASTETKASGGFGTATGGGFGSPTSGGFSAGGSVAQQGFGGFSQPSQPQAASSGFGSPPSFGSAPAFGGSPGFGSTAAFSNPLGTSSQGFGSSGGGAFSQSSSAAPSFAANDAPTFGGIAAQSSTAPTFGSLAQGSPGFGGGGAGGFGSGGGFGAAAVFQQPQQQQPTQTGFGSSSGGFGQTPSSQSSAFSSWR